jgi:diacylglycerol O-acyltransferase
MMPTSQRLSSIEAIMWRIGHHAPLRMTVGNLMVLDKPPTREALLERLTAAAEQAPRLRQRPHDASRLRNRPAWVDDDDFDASHHLRTVAVPSPGGQRELLDVVALLEPAPFDPDRPPWDVTVFEGLERDRGALYLRAHHALTDGMGGISLISSLLDEPRWPAVTAPEPAEPTEPGAEAVPPVVSSRRRPGTVTVTIDLTRAAGAATNAAAALNVDPLDAVVRGVQRSLDVADSVSRQVVVTGGPLSPLPAARSSISRLEVMSVPDARAAALALGGSRNDLLVAATAAGLGLYHERVGLPCSALRLAMPASRHRNGGAGGNWFAPTRVEVPTTSGHPGPHFGVVAERLARARSEPAVRLTAALATAVGHLPTRLLVPALEAQANTVDFVATCVPGFRDARHVCGSLIEESYPFGPRLGCLMNITGFGHSDRFDIGIAVDPSAISDPELLLSCLSTAFQGLVTKLGQPTGRPRERGGRPSAGS